MISIAHHQQWSCGNKIVDLFATKFDKNIISCERLKKCIYILYRNLHSISRYNFVSSWVTEIAYYPRKEPYINWRGMIGSALKRCQEDFLLLSMLSSLIFYFLYSATLDLTTKLSFQQITFCIKIIPFLFNFCFQLLYLRTIYFMLIVVEILFSYDTKKKLGNIVSCELIFILRQARALPKIVIN